MAYSMILGTRKKRPSRAGAFASSASVAGGFATASSRNAARSSSTCAVGATALVSTELSRANASRMWARSAVRRSSSSGARRSRASAATRRTSSRVMAIEARYRSGPRSATTAGSRGVAEVVDVHAVADVIDGPVAREPGALGAVPPRHLLEVHEEVRADRVHARLGRGDLGGTQGGQGDGVGRGPFQAEVREPHRRGRMRVEPATERRQILSPVNVAVVEMVHAPGRPADELVEVREM